MKKLPAIAASALAMSVVLLPSADAHSATRSCETNDGTHNLNMTIHYATTASYHTWTYAQYILGGAGTGGKSNLHLRMWSGGVLNYSFISSDDLDNDHKYTKNFPNFSTPRVQHEVWKGHAVFDVFGGDPSCTAELEY